MEDPLDWAPAIRNVRAELRIWACGAVVARVAYNDKPTPFLPSGGDQQEQTFVQVRTSIRVQQVAASSTEWHRLDQIPYEF